VALTRTLACRAGELGLVLHVAHLHHGLRSTESDEDQQFAAELAVSLGLVFHTHKVDTAAEAAASLGSGRSVEDAARRLRYSWFRQLMAFGAVDAVATAHTLDDQAETVLGKFLRGAWTEGLSGIHPVVSFPEGPVLRPLLAATRPQVEAYLAALGQSWREDSSNRDSIYTRNRIRHDLLPELERWNPKIREHLTQVAELARDEEAWWQSELVRVAPDMLLAGSPVRGGGRANASQSSIALDVVRFRAVEPALQRRLLRYAAGKLGVSLSFEATESLRRLAVEGRAGQRLALPGPISAERTPRELRLEPGLTGPPTKRNSAESSPRELPIPGEVKAFGLHFRAQASESGPPANIRSWRPGDRVTLRHSSGSRKIKEVLERLKVTGAARAEWPVVEWQGHIVWMQGAELEPVQGLTLLVGPDLVEPDKAVSDHV
jgi:tRNA(Ile)-lysidine synthase